MYDFLNIKYNLIKTRSSENFVPLLLASVEGFFIYGYFVLTFLCVYTKTAVACMCMHGFGSSFVCKLIGPICNSFILLSNLIWALLIWFLGIFCWYFYMHTQKNGCSMHMHAHIWLKLCVSKLDPSTTFLFSWLIGFKHSLDFWGFYVDVHVWIVLSIFYEILL